MTWDKGFNSHTNGAFTPSVLRALGLKTIPESDSAAYAELTLETLAAAKPDVMFLTRTTSKTLQDGWAANPVYTSIPAVATNQVFTVDSFVWSKSRGLVSAELIAAEAIKTLYST